MSKILSITLVVIAIVTVIALIYTIAIPVPREKFSEFYILDKNDKATNYPTQLKLGEDAKLIIGIENQEQTVVLYRVEIQIDRATNGKLGPVILNHNEKFKQLVTFTPDKIGAGQKVEFLLYKQGGNKPCLKTHLWVNVD